MENSSPLVDAVWLGRQVGASRCFLLPSTRGVSLAGMGHRLSFHDLSTFGVFLYLGLPVLGGWGLLLDLTYPELNFSVRLSLRPWGVSPPTSRLPAVCPASLADKIQALALTPPPLPSPVQFLAEAPAPCFSPAYSLGPHSYKPRPMP